MKKILYCVLFFAVITCFASPIKSIIGGRNTILSYLQENTSAKSYIQFGLVCLYDGIENGGYGIHNEGTGYKWIECISGYEATESRLMFYSDGVGWNYLYTLKLPTVVSNMTEWTVEYVAKLSVNMGGDSFIRSSIGDHYYYPHLTSKGENSRILIGNAYTGFNIPNPENNTTYAVWRMSTTPESITGLSILGESIQCTNGAVPWGEFGKTSLLLGDNVGNVCRIKCIRIYNRPLLDYEIQYNYRIDCERFKE